MPIQVLLVEDSPGDVRLTQEAFPGADIVKSINDFWPTRAKLSQSRHLS
jgi:hypothetical protein